MADRLVNAESHSGYSPPPRSHINNDQNPDFVLQETEKIGPFHRSRTFHHPSARVSNCYPDFSVLIRAIHGRGGKNVRIVNSSRDSTEELTSAQRESAKSFGNTTVLVGKYITHPRRVEVQAFAGEHEDAVSL